MTTVTLHIGRHKTGTSSIQATLAANRDLLRSRGVLYPASLPENHSGFFRDAFAPNPESFPINKHNGLNREAIQKMARRQLDDVSREFESFQGSHLIFSAEDACTLPLEGVRNIKKLLDERLSPNKYQIIFYTRHPVSRALSGIQQNVKGNGLTLEDAIDFHIRGGGPSYANITKNFSDVFGESFLKVRAFEAALETPGGPVVDFFLRSSVDPTDLRQMRRNDSIAAEMVYFLSWLYEGPRHTNNPRLHHRATRVPLNDTERSMLFDIKGAKPNFLSQQEIDFLWNAVESDMAFLERHYGIAYRKSEATAAGGAHLFTQNFLDQINAVLPSLSTPLQEELSTFFDTQKYVTNRSRTV